MRINADFSHKVAIDTNTIEWVDSPLPGVQRRMLDRIGGEVARATSLVRYEPGSVFKEHVHNGGEEFLVLEGVFEDEHGKYPKGCYVRNPVGSRHTPKVPKGCLILVKLRQMDENDKKFVRIGTGAEEKWTKGSGERVKVLSLHDYGTEYVGMTKFDEGGRETRRPFPKGREIYVLEGSLQDDEVSYSAGWWIRLPPGATQELVSTTGALIWTKEGHLSLE